MRKSSEEVVTGKANVKKISALSYGSGSSLSIIYSSLTQFYGYTCICLPFQRLYVVYTSVLRYPRYRAPLRVSAILYVRNHVVIFHCSVVVSAVAVVGVVVIGFHLCTSSCCGLKWSFRIHTLYEYWTSRIRRTSVTLIAFSRSAAK